MGLNEETKEELKKELELLMGQIIETQKTLLVLQRQSDGIKNLLSSYEPNAFAETDQIVASKRTIIPERQFGLSDATRYINSSMWEACSDILSNSNKYLTSREICDALIAGGKKIGSEDKMQYVNIALYKFEKKKRIKSKKVGNRKGYQLA